MYLDFYSLKEMPFTADWELGKISKTKNLHVSVPQLLKEINKNGELKVIISEQGAEKTTLIQSLIKSISDDFYVIPILKPAKSTYGLLCLISGKLGIPFSSSPIDEMVPKILNSLKNIVNSGKKPLLILNDAHVFSQNIFGVVQNLFRINKSVSNFLRILLIGRPYLEQKLYETNKKFHLEKNWSTIQLAKLNYNESEKYIKNRIQNITRGKRSVDIFTKNAIQKIVEYSNGNQRKINILCNNALVLGCLSSLNIINGEIIEKVKSDELCLHEIKNLVQEKKQRALLTDHSATNVIATPPLNKEPFKAEKADKAKLFNSATDLPTEPSTYIGKNAQTSQGLEIVSKEQKYGSSLIRLNIKTEIASPDLIRIIENIYLNSADKKLQVIGVLSPTAQQGSTTIAMEIAKLLSKQNGSESPDRSDNLLFVDANINHPVHESTRGISEILLHKNGTIDDVISNTNLDFFYTSIGKSSAFKINKIKDVFVQFKRHFKFIIVDLPPVLHAQNSIQLANFCDGIIMVVQAGKCKYEVIDEAKKQLEKSGTPILGGVLNKRKFFIPNWLYKMI